MNHIYNGKKGIDYDKIADVARRIIEGTATITRLNPKEEQGRCKAGRIHVESSILLGADRRANCEKFSKKETYLIAERQEKLLKKYAKKRKIWFNEKNIAGNALRRLPDGMESHIYLEQDGKHVIKVMNYFVMDELPENYLDNRISLHNYLFEDTKYELFGFTENEDGFAFIVRQPYIQGIELEAETKEEDVQQCERLNRFMKNTFDMDYTGGNTYYNSNYVIDDLHLNNVLEDRNGNFYFIDTVPSLNVTEDNLGGVREYLDFTITMIESNKI
jgi:hypothetical protein